MLSNFLEEAATWISNLNPANIPSSVYTKAAEQLQHAQYVICQTAIEMGHIEDESECKDIDFYAYKNLHLRAIERMKYDWDDYLFMAHSGHSSVLVTQAEAHRLGITSQEEILKAIIVGNEISGRVAAASIFGHQNGQAWTFVHQLSTIASIASLNNWPKEKTMRVLGISFSQPHFALFPGFFSYAKATAAWLPINTALESIRLEPLLPAGLPKDLVAGSGGMLEYFTNVPVTFFLEGLGKSWVTLAMMLKKYPSCAYFQNAVSRLDNHIKRNGLIDPSSIKKIVVDTNILSIGVEETMRRHIKLSDPLTTEEVSFSMSLPLSVLLLHGLYDIKALDQDFLTLNQNDIRQLASKISMNHKWEYTANVLKRINSAVNLKSVMKSIGLSNAFDIVRSLREYGSDNHLMRSALLDKEFYKLVVDLFKICNNENYTFSNANFEGFSWDFESQIYVYLKNGEKIII